MSGIRESTNGGGKILVVDDETSIVDAVATALRYEGFEVEEAATGREALSAVARFDPDLIVLDWMLPDIDGIEVGRRLREQGQRNAILFLTAKDAVENKVEALRACSSSTTRPRSRTPSRPRSATRASTRARRRPAGPPSGRSTSSARI